VSSADDQMITKRTIAGHGGHVILHNYRDTVQRTTRTKGCSLSQSARVHFVDPGEVGLRMPVRAVIVTFLIMILW